MNHASKKAESENRENKGNLPRSHEARPQWGIFEKANENEKIQPNPG
jgi:hypothetical protein